VIKLAILSLLIGSILGLRYRVFVLVPVVVVGSGIVIALSAIHGGALREMTWATVIFATLVQFGYAGTLFLKVNAASGERTAPVALLSNPKLKS
jgi:hypothetical protein